MLQCMMPSERQLIDLAHAATFPANRDEVIAAGQHHHHDPTVINFMRIFHPTDQFESAIDFMNRCEAAELFLHEASHALWDSTSSP